MKYVHNTPQHTCNFVFKNAQFWHVQMCRTNNFRLSRYLHKLTTTLMIRNIVCEMKKWEKILESWANHTLTLLQFCVQRTQFGMCKSVVQTTLNETSKYLISSPICLLHLSKTQRLTFLISYFDFKTLTWVPHTNFPSIITFLPLETAHTTL